MTPAGAIFTNLEPAGVNVVGVNAPGYNWRQRPVKESARSLALAALTRWRDGHEFADRIVADLFSRSALVHPIAPSPSSFSTASCAISPCSTSGSGSSVPNASPRPRAISCGSGSTKS